MQRLQHQLSNSFSKCANNGDQLTDADELVAHRSYPRPKVIEDDIDNIELSDEIIVKLWIARLKALQNYKEV
jgi:hypothetical protein